MKNLLLGFITLFLIGVKGNAQDSLLKSKDIEVMTDLIMKNIMIPDSSLRKINEESFIVAFAIKDSVLISLIVLGSQESELLPFIQASLSNKFLNYKTLSLLRGNFTIGLSIINSSTLPTNRPKTYTKYNDFSGLCKSLSKYNSFFCLQMTRSVRTEISRSQ